MKILSNCKTIKEINQHVESCSKEDLKRFLSHYSGSGLGNHTHASNTLVDPLDGVAYIRKVFASALSVVNNAGRHISGRIWSFIDLILGYVKNNGFLRFYTRDDIKMIFAYQKLYRLSIN